MKKIGNLILVICSLFLLSGCMKHNVSMTINKDKSMDLEIIYAIDVDQIENMMNSFNDTTDDGDETLDDTLDDSTDIDMDMDIDEDFNSSSIDTEDEKNALEKRGYKVVEYDNDGYKGVKATLKINSIDDVSVEEDLKVKLSDILDEDFDDSKFFTVKKGFFKNTYIANFVYEMNDTDSSSNPITSLSNLDIKYTVLLPNKSISNNADTVRENELSWIISLDKTTNVEYSFEMLNMTNIYITGGIGILLLVVIIVIIILASKKKHKNNKTSNNSNIEETSTIDNSIVNLEQNDTINPNIDITMPNMNVNTDLNIQQPSITNMVDTISNEDIITDTMMLDTNDIQNSITNEENKLPNKTCPQCGVEVLENQRFCENCGKQLN